MVHLKYVTLWNVRQWNATEDLTEDERSDWAEWLLSHAAGARGGGRSAYVALRARSRARVNTRVHL